MKYVFCLLFLLSSTISAQSLLMSGEYNKFFSGYGDQWGDAANVNLSFKIYKKLYLSASLNIGSATSRVYTKDDLANIENLLIFDEFGDNYPFAIFSRPFNFGTHRLIPNNNYTTFLDFGIGLTQQLIIKKKSVLAFEAGYVMRKVESSYITFKGDVIVQNPYSGELIQTELTVPLIQSFIDYQPYVGFSYNFKLKENFGFGPVFRITFGDVMTSSVGFNIRAYLY